MFLLQSTATVFLLFTFVSISFSQVTAAGPPATAAAEGRRLSLKEAVDLALERNPAIRAAASGRKIADAQLSEARAGRWPLVQFSETFTRSNNPVFVFGSLLEQHRFTAQNFDIGNLNHPDSINNYRTALNLKL
ncbi:MAG TPA: TolC family protein, partial [Thermodesulfobacteriota bacterium]|nr:TolC family protein [Thermodesulfobacteriota bacterium]